MVPTSVRSRGARARSVLVLGMLLALPALPLIASPASAAPQVCDVRGPDAGNYWCEVTAYLWEDVAGGTGVFLTDDSVSGSITLPFAFTWYGQPRTSVVIGSNGVLCFTSTGCSDVNPPAPPNSTAPNDLLACFWEDLNPGAAGSVRYKTVGTSPARTFVVEFLGVPHFPSRGNNTFQFHLRENGDARCMFDRVESDADGQRTLVGTENAQGTAGVRYQYAEFAAQSTGVRFFHCACTTPGAPRSLAAETGPARGEIQLTWQAPSSTGNTTITTYRVYRGTTSGNLQLHATLGNVTRYTDSGLANGASFVYQVSAANFVGEGPRSGEVQGRAPSLPGAPTGLAASTGPGRGEITLRWTAPADTGGVALSGYRVLRGTSAGNLAPLATLGNVTSFVDTGLPDGTTRVYRVAAQNVVGEGPGSGDATGRTATLPSAPRNLQASSGPALLQLTLRWDPPSDTGGVQVQNYTIYRGTRSGEEVFLAKVGNVTSYADNTASWLGVNYYRITASNVVGEGPVSNEVCAAVSPWGDVPPVAGAPCPLPAGWRERVLVQQVVPLGGSSQVTPAVSVNLLVLDARPQPSDPRYYEVIARVGGSALPVVTVYTAGTVQTPLHVELLHVPAVTATVPGYTAKVTVAHRYDPSRVACYVSVGGACVLNTPLDVFDPGWMLGPGADAALTARIEVRDAQGTTVADQAVVIPLAGQLGAAVV